MPEATDEKVQFRLSQWVPVSSFGLGTSDVIKPPQCCVNSILALCWLWLSARLGVAGFAGH